MVEVFLEHTQNKVAHADVGRLGGVRYERIGRCPEREPVKRKLGHLRMGDLQGCRVGGAVRQQFVQDEPGRCENRRIETAAEHDRHAIYLRLHPHAMPLWSARPQ